MRANFIPALAVGIVAFYLFRRAYLGASSVAARIMLILAAAALGIPAVIFASNYLFLIPYAKWFIELHALPGAEIMSGFAGAMLGIMLASDRLRPGKLNGPILILCSVMTVALVTAPFIKQLYGSVDYSSLVDSWGEGVCLQTSGYTCMPACAATVIRLQGGHVTESELARCVGSTVTGTEVWYLKRGLAKHGYKPSFHHVRSIKKAPVNSILSVTYTGIPHVVVLLKKTAQGVVVGEPLRGRRHYTWQVFQRYYHSDGTYIMIERLPNS